MRFNDEPIRLDDFREELEHYFSNYITVTITEGVVEALCDSTSFADQMVEIVRDAVREKLDELDAKLDELNAKLDKIISSATNS